MDELHALALADPAPGAAGVDDRARTDLETILSTPAFAPVTSPAESDPTPTVLSEPDALPTSIQRPRRPHRWLAAVAAIALIAGIAVWRWAPVSESGRVPAIPVGSSSARVTASIFGPRMELSYGSTDVIAIELKGRNRENTLVEGCMRDAGYDYQPLAVDAATVQRDLFGAPYETLIAYAPFRTKYGYGETSYIAKAPTFGLPGAQADPGIQMRSAEREVFRSCQEQADEKVWPRAAWTELQVAAEAAGIAQKINNDPDLANAWYSWSTCMNQAGYKFRYPQEPQRFIENGVVAFTNQGGVRGSAKASQLLRQEVAIANQDWDCRVQNVNSVQVATRQKIESSFLESNPGLVQAVKDAVGKTLGSK